MADANARFCSKCGAGFPDSARFCPKCGAPRSAVAPAPTPRPAAQPQPRQAAPAPGVVASAPGQPGARPAATSVAGAMRTAQMAAGYAGMAAAMPWQTVVAGERPDLSAFLRQAGVPLTSTVTRQIVRRSVRKPAFALLFTTLLDALVALISGQPAALSALGMRVITGSGTAFLGLIVGKRQGFGRYLVGIGSILTTVLQLYSTGAMLIAAISAQSPFLTLVPSLISTVSVIVVAVKTILMTLRRKKVAP